MTRIVKVTRQHDVFLMFGTVILQILMSVLSPMITAMTMLIVGILMEALSALVTQAIMAVVKLVLVSHYTVITLTVNINLDIMQIWMSAKLAYTYVM